MAKKKKSANAAKAQNRDFVSDPFRYLKGFAVSAAESEEEVSSKKQPPTAQKTQVGSFADEMAMLGVTKLNLEDADQESLDEEIEVFTEPEAELGLTDDEQFLRAMGALQVNFEDQLPDLSDDGQPSASARRMKQLQQGKLKPEASFDLHGLKRSEVAERIRFFLQNADRQGLKTVLLITGRGLHSEDGEPVLRNETEVFLAAEGRIWVAEWSRAPKQYGGNGALILFLKQRPV